MSDDTQAQINNLVEVREAHRRRLRVLQVQIAEHGERNAPAQMLTEAQEIDQKLAQINRDLRRLQHGGDDFDKRLPSSESMRQVAVVPQTINEHLIVLAGVTDRFQETVRREFAAIHQLITTSIEQIHSELSDEHYERIGWQMQEKITRTSERMHNNVLFISIGVVLIVLVIAVAVLATVVMLRLNT